jgi:hypothetical protein
MNNKAVIPANWCAAVQVYGQWFQNLSEQCTMKPRAFKLRLYLDIFDF